MEQNKGLVILIITIIIYFWGGSIQNDLTHKIYSSVDSSGSYKNFINITDDKADSVKSLNKLYVRGSYSLPELNDRLEVEGYPPYIRKLVYSLYPSYRFGAKESNLNGTLSVRRFINSLLGRAKAIVATKSFIIAIPVALFTYLFTLVLVPLMWITDILFYFNFGAVFGSIADLFIVAFDLIKGSFGGY